MSKERAIRRAVRLEAERREREARARMAARRAKRRALARRLTPRLPDRRVGRLFPRRARGQRAGIVLTYVAALLLIWLLVADLPARIALTAALTVAAPAIVVIAFGRR
jgi:predicted phage tail protein